MAEGEVVGEAGRVGVREAPLAAARAAGAPAGEGWEERAEGSEGPAADFTMKTLPRYQEIMAALFSDALEESCEKFVRGLYVYVTA